MTQNTPNVSSAAAMLMGGATDPAAQAAQRRAASEAAASETMAAIREKGFSAYVEDLEKEKLEKMREELLRTLGLTEEDLAEMDPEARNALEARISNEIQKRLAAASLLNAEGKDGHEQAVQTALQVLQANGGAMTGATVQTGALSFTDAGAGSQGQGRGTLARDMVLALQEADDAVTPPDSRARGRGLPA